MFACQKALGAVRHMMLPMRRCVNHWFASFRNVRRTRLTPLVACNWYSIPSRSKVEMIRRLRSPRNCAEAGPGVCCVRFSHAGKSARVGVNFEGTLLSIGLSENLNSMSVGTRKGRIAFFVIFWQVQEHILE